MSLEDLSLEARDELAALAKKLADNPTTRKEFLKLTKQVNPDLPIPELEIEERANNVFQQADQRVSSLEAQLRERDARDELEKRRQALIDSGKIKSKDDIAKVEKVMLEQGITNHETAADYWQWMQQAAEPTPSGYNPQVMNKWDLSKFMKNPVGAARDEASKALNELRRPNRPIGL